MGDPVTDRPRVDPLAPATRRRRDEPLLRWIRHAVVGDVGSAILAVSLAAVLRFGWHDQGAITGGYALASLAIALIWPILGALCGTYELRTSLFGVEELRRVLRAGIALAAVLGMTHFMFKLSLSRGYVAALIPLVVSITAIWRVLLRGETWRWMHQSGHHHKAVAVGSVDEIAHLCHKLASDSRSAIDIVAFVAHDLGAADLTPASLDGVIRLPHEDAIRELATHGIAVDLLVRAGRPRPDEMVALSQRAHELELRLAIAPRREDPAANMAVSYVPLGQTPLLMVETPTLGTAARLVKGALDRGIAVVALIVVAPVLGVLAATIAVCEGRPVLFRQTRVGRNGAPFDCLKLRTMRRDAEERLAELVELNEGSGPLFKMREDPRITRTGRWMRKYSLDELPQLWNVIRGDMSIVGPRPSLPSEAATFDPRTARRLLVKPGLTGLWQVEGRSDLPWDDGVYLDLMYVDHWSPLLDAVIIARTVKTVLRPDGAY